MSAQNQDGRDLIAIEQALALITQAIDILDAHGGPPNASTQLAIAQQTLREALRDRDRDSNEPAR